ncbi:MAG: hypothetical protein KIS92_26875 [Planctomycetota bacterium]|nr:hypothetical protein [Planctomycetota bacterium]
MNEFQRKGEVLGFPLRVSAPARLKRCLRWFRPRTSREPHVLDVTLTEDPRAASPRGERAIQGVGFVLDLSARRLYLAPPASALACTKTLLLALGILAEHYGPERVAARGSNGLAPLPLHASSVKTPRGALVFCGHSTFGKTTISTKLLARLPLLGEDLVYALVGPFGARSKAKAFIAAPGRKLVPLRGLFWLRKSPECALRPLPSSAAAAGMIHPIFGMQRPENARHRLAMLRRLLEAAPCRELYFRKERASLCRLLKQHGLL